LALGMMLMLWLLLLSCTMAWASPLYRREIFSFSFLAVSRKKVSSAVGLILSLDSFHDR
jgi:hypothetical protein